MITKCRFWAKNVPLEDFRLPKDGRKWRQASRSRRAMFIELADRANNDGSFLREVANKTVNFSPSFRKLRMHYANGTLSRLLDDLKELGFLTWVREKNQYGRRIYTIREPADAEVPTTGDGKRVQDAPNNSSQIQPERLTHWGNNTSHIQENSSRIREEQFPPPELIPVPTSSSIPSFEVPSLAEPSKTCDAQVTRLASPVDSYGNRDLPPQQENYRDTGKLVIGALSILLKAKSMGQNIHSANVVEDLKSYAADHGIRYQGLVARALDIAEQRIKTL
jgi:hypothetical protein